MKKVKPDLYKHTIVLRGGALSPGEHVERFALKADAEIRLTQLRREAQAAGEPLVFALIPPVYRVSR